MDKGVRLRCPDCGALNVSNALDCVECGLPLFRNHEGPSTSLLWIDALPGWIRWVLALPVIAIAGAVVVRLLLFVGIDDLPGLIFPSAVAVAIVMAAISSGRIAPTHGRYVGVAVAVADTVVLITALLFKFYDNPPPPELNVVHYAIGGVAGLGAAIFIILKGVTTGLDGSMPKLFTELGSRSSWSLGILRSLFPATALSAMCAFASLVLPRYVPVGVSIDIGIVLVPAVTVTAFGAYAPTNNVIASRIVAGTICALGAASLITTIIAFVQFPPDVPEWAGTYGFIVMHRILQSIGLVCGAAIGLDAASKNCQERAAAPSD